MTKAWVSIISVNNQSRQECLEYFVEINGTQLAIRTLLGAHNKRDSNLGNEVMVHDLVWILGALASKGRN